MLGTRSMPVFYVGLLDGNPAYSAFTQDSLTCQIFRNLDAAKKHFKEIASVRIEPTIKVTVIPSWEYTDLHRQIQKMEEQLGQLKGLRTQWWVARQLTIVRAWVQRIFH